MDYSKEPRRDIFCIDVKSFFASVEAVERKIHPLHAMIAVVSKPESQGGLVLAASPLVKKKYGIKTGSRVFDFPKKSDIQIVEPRMALYLEKNLEIIQIFRRYAASQDVYSYSIDEAFIDITHSKKLFGSAFEIADQIQTDIWQELGLVVTIGIGDNPLLAKLALDNEAKKRYDVDFISRWSYEDVPDKLWPIAPLSKFWGIGPKTEKKLNWIGLKTIGDLAQYDLAKLKKKFGLLGEQMFFHAHGIDRTILSDTYVPKSTSFSKNQILSEDYTDQVAIEIVIREMVEENAARLRKHRLVTSRIGLGIGYSDRVLDKGFRHQIIIDSTDSNTKLTDHFVRLFKKYYQGNPVRVINISFGKLAAKESLQLSIFEDTESIVRDEHLNQAIDHVRKKFGYTSLLHANSLLKGSTAIYRSNILGGHQANHSKEEKEGI